MYYNMKNIFIFGIIATNLWLNVLSECTDNIYLEQSEITNYHKRRSTTTFPALDWRNKIISNGLGLAVNQPVDFEKYELMLHASNSYKGVMIWRVCEKNTDYHAYGTINTQQLRGYTIKFHDMYKIDRYLSFYQFQTYGTSKKFIQKTEENAEKEKLELYKKNHPINYYLWIIFINLSKLLPCILFGGILINGCS